MLGFSDVIKKYERGVQFRLVRVRDGAGGLAILVISTRFSGGVSAPGQQVGRAGAGAV
jgi:hypothetical protein